MFRAIFNGGVQRPMELPLVGGKRSDFGNAVKGVRIDWKAWPTFCKDAGWISETTDSPPRDVLLGLEHYAPQFTEWREWRTRPRCRFALDTRDILAMPLPHLATFPDAAKLFALRMRAYLAVGESAAAYEDFRNGVQAFLVLQKEPLMITGLVRITALAIILDAVGDGLAQHAWADAELRAIAADLAPIRVPEAYALAFASERGFGNQAEADGLALSPLQRAQRYAAINAANVFGPSSFPPPWAVVFVPRRVYRDNQLRYNQHMDELSARATEDGTRFLPGVGTSSSLEELKGLDAYYYFLFARANGVFSEVGKRFGYLQVQLDETRVALALERSQLARSDFPETLAELVPEFLAAVPVDTWAEKPLVYRRKEGGTFLLYGLGRNLIDDGGGLEPKRGDRQQHNDVWLYAPPPR